MAIGRKEKVSGTPVVSARASVFLVGARTHGQHWDEGQQSTARLARLVAHVSNDDRWRWEERAGTWSACLCCGCVCAPWSGGRHILSLWFSSRCRTFRAVPRLSLILLLCVSRCLILRRQAASTVCRPLSEQGEPAETFLETLRARWIPP
jgi:hypothetical protein